MGDSLDRRTVAFLATVAVFVWTLFWGMLALAVWTDPENELGTQLTQSAFVILLWAAGTIYGVAAAAYEMRDLP